ncbi:MAG TPA: ABC-2 family transporter protein [Chloroflexota bacterium]|nr:ABC-2 family transporter protein [Chloroflexota bacterium]
MNRALFSDLALYRRLIVLQMRAQLQYRANLLIDIATYLAVTGLEFVALLILFGSFPRLGDWTVGQVALLYGVSSFGFGLAEMIGAGIDGFNQTILRGEFDRLLVRPVGAFIQVVGSDFRLRRLGRITQGIAAIAVSLHLLPGIHWTIAQVLVLSAGIASTAAIFLSVLLLGATICFWTVETTELTNILTYGGCYMLSYPLSIYGRPLQRFFLFVVPLAFGGYAPVCYVLGRPLALGLPGQIALAAPAVAALFALVSAAFWRLGVRHYQSTGS